MGGNISIMITGFRSSLLCYSCAKFLLNQYMYVEFYPDDDNNSNNVTLEMKSELSWFHSLFVGVPDLMKQEFNDLAEVIGSSHASILLSPGREIRWVQGSFSPVGSNIWFKLYGPPSDRDVDLIGSLANTSMEYNPLYDTDKGFNVMPSSFHDVGDVEFQDNWGRVWVDIGTSDCFALDVLLSCLTVLSLEYLGIQQLVFGGRSMGDWEEGMKNLEDGYKYLGIQQLVFGGRSMGDWEEGMKNLEDGYKSFKI
ncbi:hypothetical protein CTI12_AA110620 [Artemisia annua]|uniref:Uncharacterized protein n=1 Tax=Artemisia annua TaxID=35608 RepID=A0A2U1PVC8_ARTAN|nr:hypothetical protein CTI12_AA110620 [Artemisia annua]